MNYLAQLFEKFEELYFFPVAISLILLDIPYWFLYIVWGSFYGGPATLNILVLTFVLAIKVISNPEKLTDYIVNISKPLAVFTILFIFLSFYHDTFEYNYLSGFFILIFFIDFLFYKNKLLLDRVIISSIVILLFIVVAALIIYFSYRYFPVLIYQDLGYRASWESSLTSKYGFYVQVLVLLTLYYFGLNKLRSLFIILISIIFLSSFELDGPLIIVYTLIFVFSANSILKKINNAGLFIVACFLFLLSLFIFKPLFIQMVLPFLEFIESPAVGASHGLWVRLFQSLEAMQLWVNTNVFGLFFGIGIGKAATIDFYEHGIVHSGIFMIILGYGIIGVTALIYIIMRLVPFGHKLNFASLAVLILFFSYMILNGLLFAFIPFLITLARDSYGKKMDWELR